MKIEKFQARVAEKKFLTKKVCWLKLRLIKPAEIKFLPGQFVSLEVAPAAQDLAAVRRPYSLVSLESPADFVELIADISPGGVGSRFFQKVRVGERVDFLGPMGRFVLRKSEGEVVFLAASTGIAPFRPMIYKKMSNVYLIWGFRYEEDIFWQDYFEELAKREKNFHFTLTLSRPGPDWKGKRGYVQEYIPTSSLQLPTSNFYICGGNNMVRGVVDFLRKKGVGEEKIHFEIY